MDDLLSRKGLSLDRLRSFLAVADAGGMARAAPGDPVRQSQLSRQVGELEAAFGVALTERRGRSVALTAAGRQLAGVLRESFQRLSEVAAQGRDTVPTWSLGAGDSLLHWRVIPALGRLKLPRPDLVLTALGTAQIVGMLEDGRLDLGLVRRAEVPKGLRARPVGTVQDALFVPQRLHRKASLAQVLASVPLALTYGEPGIVEHVQSLARRAGVEPRVELLCETFLQAARAVKTGRYAAVLPSIAAGEVDAAQVSTGNRGVSILLAWHPRLERRAGAQEYLATMASALAW